MNSIQLEQVTKAFGHKEVLKEVSFSVATGEIFGLLGPSGAGKTTLIKLLTGQLSYGGTATILGQNCNKLDRGIYNEIGMVLDNCGLYERLSCYDNMMLFARIHGVSKEEVKLLLKKVGLKDGKMSASKISKGMTQRLVLARALLHQPKLLFLDEPTSGLDPATAEEIHKLLLELKNNGTTIFLTTHNMSEAYTLCDHLALLNDGTIVEYGAPDELCRKYNKENIINILCKDGTYVSFNNTPDNAGKIAEYFANGSVEAIHSSEPNLKSVFMILTGRELDL